MPNVFLIRKIDAQIDIYRALPDVLRARMAANDEGLAQEVVDLFIKLVDEECKEAVDKFTRLRAVAERT